MPLTEEAAFALYNQFKDQPGDVFTWEVNRRLRQRGKTFSEEAMDDLFDMIRLFIGARIMNRWEQTKEPPTVLKVELTVVAQ
jgi:hypothetical protein